MHVLKFIVLMILIFLLYNVVKYYNNIDYQKKCDTYYIPLIDPYKYSKDHSHHFKGYEKKDNLSFLKYRIK
tara:strand:+ start:2693 stop:2905 length:213 start_codon:yes stop_codon:yes gene_type:complete